MHVHVKRVLRGDVTDVELVHVHRVFVQGVYLRAHLEVALEEETQSRLENVTSCDYIGRIKGCVQLRTCFSSWLIPT